MKLRWMLFAVMIVGCVRPLPPGSDARVVVASVHMRPPRALDAVLVGRVRGLLATNVASVAQLSDRIADLIHKAMVAPSTADPKASAL